MSGCACRVIEAFTTATLIASFPNAILPCMRVLRSQAEPDLTHVLFSKSDVRELVEALRKPHNETAKALRAELKKVLK